MRGLHSNKKIIELDYMEVDQGHGIIDLEVLMKSPSAAAGKLS